MTDTSLHIPALKKLVGQRRVQEFLDRVGVAQKIGQSYLFVGPKDAGELDAALILGQMLVCPHGGCGVCEECQRVVHDTEGGPSCSHPDVKVLKPKGVDGYLVSQIRDLIAEIPLAPIRAKNKLYIICDADKLGTSASNALLKSIEEPPSGTHFVLIAESASQLLPTIESRCQSVVFSSISEAEALSLVIELGRVDSASARIALSVGRTPKGALTWLADLKRQELRQATISALTHALSSDSLAIYSATKELVVKTQGTKEERQVKLKEFKEGEKEYSDFISTQKVAKEREADFKRQTDSQAKRLALEVFAISSSLVRDLILQKSGQDARIVNTDAQDFLQLASSYATIEGAKLALMASRDAERKVRLGTDFSLTFEVMLFHIREALGCPPYYQ